MKKFLINVGLLLGAFTLTLGAQIIITPTPFTPGGSGTITGGTCTNQAVTAIDTSGVPTCTTITSAYVNGSIAPTASPTFTTLLTLNGQEVVTSTLTGAGGDTILVTSTGTSADNGGNTFNGLRVTHFANPTTDLDQYHLAINARLETDTNNANDYTAAYSIGGLLDHAGTGIITDAYGLLGSTTNRDTGTLTRGYGLWLELRNLSTGTITNGYGIGIISPTNSGGGTFGTYYGIHVDNVTVTGGTSDYAFWYSGGGGDCNGGGVARIRQDGTFAYYNPCFTTYVPDAVDFERLLIRWGDTGVFGTDNTAYLGVEEGGTGVMRPLVLMGSAVRFEDDAAAFVTAQALRYDTATNCLDSAGAAACGSATAGTVVMDAAATTVVVSTTSVTAASEIFIQEDSSLGTRLSVTCNTASLTRNFIVTARTAGTSFTITSSAAPVTNPACLSYKIVN